MADEVKNSMDEVKDPNNPISLIINDEEGNETKLTAAQVLEAAAKNEGGGSKYVEESITFVDYIFPGFVEIDLHPSDPHGVFDYINLIELGEGNGLRPGRYFILTDEWANQESNHIRGFDDDEVKAISDGTLYGVLLTADPGLIVGDGLEAMPVTIGAANNEGEALEDPPYEPFEIYMLRVLKDDTFVSSLALAKSLYVMGAINLAIDTYTKSAGEETMLTRFDENSPLIVKTGKLFTEAMRGKRKSANEIWPLGDAFIAEVGDLKMVANEEKALDTAIGSSKTMIYLNAAATATNYRYEPDRVCIVEASMTDLLEKRKLKNTKKNRAKIRNEVNSIALTSWTMKRADNGEFVTIPVAGGKCWAKGDVIHFAFSPDFMGAVLNREAGRMAANPILLGTDDVKYPHALTIGWKLSTHSYQNLGKKNETTLSVAKLLEFAEGIPSFEDVRESNRAYTQRIIEPLEKSLNHLAEIGLIEYWDYCHENGEPLTDEEQDQRFNDDGEECALPYEIARDLNIQWKLSKAYEEQREQTMKARENRALRVEAAKQKKAERQKRIDRKIESNIAKAKAREIIEKEGE